MRLSIVGFVFVFLGLNLAQALPPWIAALWTRRPSLGGLRRALLAPRGGSSSGTDHATSPEDPLEETLAPATFFSHVSKRHRHSSDFILDLRKRASETGNDRSTSLRQLITARFEDYVAEFREVIREFLSNPSQARKFPQPQRLLHYLAPKIPAIKQSPDVNLRIHSARSAIDSGVAACIIGTMAHVCELYDKERIRKANLLHKEKPPSIAPEIVEDRRFEQLIECVLSGMNIEKRKQESIEREQEDSSDELNDIEEILDGEEIEESEGLSTADACRAAWGIAVLGAHHRHEMGGEKVLDLLMALSLRVRELLLARLQLLREGDILSDPSLANIRTEDRMDQLSNELAEDAASAMWTFACVRACTGLQSEPLFETCCSILCQNPVELRRRAQEFNLDQESINIGNSDVIDRLALADAETEETNANATLVQDDTNVDKDALTDWLSRTEVNDILWALALHGSTNETSTDENVALSETAATLRELAFDRMVEWLEEDLASAEAATEEAIAPEVVESVETTEKAVTVEVVDAAALLASSSSSSEESVQVLPVESMTLRSNGDDGEVHEVEVVDAAALLASMEGNNPGTVETEIMITPNVPEATTDFENTDESASSKVMQPAADAGRMGINYEPERLFSPHDLASIAWSATELRDPLRLQVLPLVIKLVAMLGETGTISLGGSDLANLAWAIARFEAESSQSIAHAPSSLSLSVASWIVNSGLERVKEHAGSEKEETNMLDVFQPPEVGRLLWAVACITSTYAQVPERIRSDTNFQELATLALNAAGSNLALFATEDLLRISWAFMEICGTNKDAFNAQTSMSLGRIISTIEQSLHRWERGDCTNPQSSDSSYIVSGSDPSPFASFFGMSRMNRPILEQLMSGHEDEEDTELTSLVVKRHRPLLQDLSVDPSTLCKAACALERIAGKHSDIKGGGKLTQVAIRLLASRNARLMKECSIHDIVRLCEAATRADTEGNNRQLITGLFAHKVVYVLNEALGGEESTIDKPEISIEAASPSEISTLIWSLANLGVKHAAADSAVETAYKRLRLVTNKPFLTQEQVKTLDLHSQTRLLQGLVLMKFFSSDISFLYSVVSQVAETIDGPRSVDKLCTLAESLALLKESIRAEVDEKRTELSDGLPKDDDQAGELDDQAESEGKGLGLVDELERLTVVLLASIATKSEGMLASFSPDNMRRLVSVYTLLPFEADSLIRAMESEVESRKALLLSLPEVSIDNMLKDAMSSSDAVKKELFTKTDSSRFAAIKNGIVSMFLSNEDSEPEESTLEEELALMIEKSINSTILAASTIQKLGNLTGTSFDSLGEQALEGQLFELGQCEELIASYRRIEFSTGAIKSRYDKERRRVISKRVLSRLLP